MDANLPLILQSLNVLLIPLLMYVVSIERRLVRLETLREAEKDDK